MRKPQYPQDKELLKLVEKEERRQQETLNFVASENITPEPVRALLSSVLVNKYSEGYGTKRYYPGTEQVNAIEELSHIRARAAFGLSDDWHINTQAYSGSVANMAVYNAVLKPGDTILSMDLKAGGHLSHGANVSVVRKLYTVAHYGVNDQYRIDYKELERLARECKPALIVSGASAYPFAINFKKIGAIAKAVGAYHMADIAHYAGLVVAGAYPSPFAYADIVTTTTHKSLWGPRGAIIMANTRSVVAKKRGVSIAGAIDRSVFPGIQGGPHMHTIAAIAAGLKMANSARFKSWARRVATNTKTLAHELQKRGVSVIGGGTQSHMLLVDTRPFGMDGATAQELLEQKKILVNKNTIAGDTSAQRPSAIRLGLYWMTSRGIPKKQLSDVARQITETLGA